MLLQPLSPAEEKTLRDKLNAWHPGDVMQDQRLDELEAFLASENVTKEVISAFRTLYDFLLRQSATTHEIDDAERAEGRTDFQLSPDHPIVQRLTKPFEQPDLTAPFHPDVTMIVNHLRESDLQARVRRLQKILDVAQARVERVATST